MLWPDVGEELEQLEVLVLAGEAEFILAVEYLRALIVHRLACTEETERKSRAAIRTEEDHI